MSDVPARRRHARRLAARIEALVPRDAPGREAAAAGLLWAVIIRRAMAAGAIPRPRGPDDLAPVDALAMAPASFGPASSHDAMAMLGECGPREVELALAAAAEHRADALIACLAVLTDWKRRGRDLGPWGHPEGQDDPWLHNRPYTT